MSLKANMKWSLVIRNWHRSHQGCNLSSNNLILADALTPALASWSCFSHPASDVPPHFQRQSSAIWTPCPRAYPKQHQGLLLTGTHILISSDISHWMFTVGDVLKVWSRKAFTVFCYRATCVLFKSWRARLLLRSFFSLLYLGLDQWKRISIYVVALH